MPPRKNTPIALEIQDVCCKNLEFVPVADPMILVAGFVASEISSRRVIFVAACDTPIDPNSLSVQRRGDGAVLVRVRSKDRPGGRLPDAVFTFWLGDPQYEYWESQLGAGPTPPYSG